MDSHQNGFHPFQILYKSIPLGWCPSWLELFPAGDLSLNFYRSKRIGLMMNKHIKKAMEMMKAAIPASGFRPETPKEWEALQLANEELSYAMFRENVDLWRTRWSTFT